MHEVVAESGFENCTGRRRSTDALPGLHRRGLAKVVTHSDRSPTFERFPPSIELAARVRSEVAGASGQDLRNSTRLRAEGSSAARCTTTEKNNAHWLSDSNFTCKVPHLISPKALLPIPSSVRLWLLLPRQAATAPVFIRVHPWSNCMDRVTGAGKAGVDTGTRRLTSRRRSRRRPGRDSRSRASRAG